MRQKYNLEEVLEERDSEYSRLSQLVLISVTDAAPRVRLSAINGLHYRYAPQIRKAYVVDNLLWIEALNEQGERVPYFIDILPWEHLLGEIYSWDLDGN